MSRSTARVRHTPDDDPLTLLASAIDAKIEEWPIERFAYGYRTSVLKTTKDQRPKTKDERCDNVSLVLGPWSLVNPIVLAAEFNIQRADPRELAAQMERTAAEREPAAA